MLLPVQKERRHSPSTEARTYEAFVRGIQQRLTIHVIHKHRWKD